MSAQKLAASASRQINAVVVSAGLMEKTHFNRTSHLLVHDPASSLRIGDIISISPGWRASKHVHHVVNSILAPFGDPIEARPKVPSEEERLAMREEKRAAKEERRRVAKEEKMLIRQGEVVEESQA
ncbi:related to ribosomal protein [Phialocephala subalpina]|uniref:Related to ribosomal protein n=1 Tax=Phialocephala subalpina TaxID=576137 RepID=A0A1L7WXT7_9HELO|nr:related to ribosomal protein [Phialocephala subalpina]